MRTDFMAEHKTRTHALIFETFTNFVVWSHICRGYVNMIELEPSFIYGSHNDPTNVMVPPGIIQWRKQKKIHTKLRYKSISCMFLQLINWSWEHIVMWILKGHGNIKITIVSAVIYALTWTWRNNTR